MRTILNKINTQKHVLLAFSLAMFLFSCNQKYEHSDLEKELSKIIGIEQFKDGSIYLVTDTGCNICYTNLKNSWTKNSAPSHLIYFTSHKQASYEKSIFKSYLQKEELTVVHQFELWDFIKNNYGFIKNYVELQVEDSKITSVLLPD